MGFEEGKDLMFEWRFERNLELPSWRNGKIIAGMKLFVNPLMFLTASEDDFRLDSSHFCFHRGFDRDLSFTPIPSPTLWIRFLIFLFFYF